MSRRREQESEADFHFRMVGTRERRIRALRARMDEATNETSRGLLQKKIAQEITKLHIEKIILKGLSDSND
ncbi:MAG TPA: hypothetical protein VK485_08330 [Sphingomicrobium sp.]|nr:hypothetical protein [Sphingomicrobium sp.]